MYIRSKNVSPPNITLGHPSFLIPLFALVSFHFVLNYRYRLQVGINGFNFRFAESGMWQHRVMQQPPCGLFAIPHGFHKLLFRPVADPRFLVHGLVQIFSNLFQTDRGIK